jgi:nucleotide-binding universal stress UspA family protein
MGEASAETHLKVLTGIDLTERSRNAFARSVELARAQGARLTLVHVTSDALPGQIAAVHDGYAQEVLEDLAAKARAEGAAHAETVNVRGRDFETLIVEARKTHADLIVLGTHRPSSLVQDMLGTTADRVLRLGGVPVLLVRSKPEGPYRSVLVAVDFSPASRRAMERAVRWFPQARIAAVTAYGTARRSLLGDDAELREAAAETRRLALKGFLDEVAEALGPGHESAIAAVVPVVERGWAEDVILKCAQEIKPDLIVVGTHARGGLQQAVLGSVAQWILTEAPCDVLAVPPTA